MSNNLTSKVNNGRADCRFNIDAVEAKYNAKYVGQFCLRTAAGNWGEDECADVFYQASPPVAGYSNYLALIIRNGTAYVTSGASGVSGIIMGVEADDGEIVYSRYRHDYRHSTDGSVWIDGGRDYTRGGANGKYVQLEIIDGEFYSADAIKLPEIE